MSLAIGYLSSDARKYTLNTICEFLKSMKEENKNKIILLILIDENSDSQFFEKNISTVGIKYVIHKASNHNNYLNKIGFFIKYSKQNNIKYCMKLDNDIIINNYTLDFIVENLDILNDDKNLLLSPILSSGIPTCDMFIDNFFNQTEKQEIQKIFLNTSFGRLWGFDYSFLNEFTTRAKNWSDVGFYEAIKNKNYYYSGIHPIRTSLPAIQYLNNWILKNKNKLFEKTELLLYVDNSSPYFCNSVFVIRTDVWEKILFDQKLYVDPFDEVPLNKYCNREKLNKIFIKNSFTLHPIYNTIPNHYFYEKQLFDQLFTFS
jgi:hypothetical protein